MSCNNISSAQWAATLQALVAAVIVDAALQASCCTCELRLFAFNESHDELPNEGRHFSTCAAKHRSVSQCRARVAPWLSCQSQA